jgi:hypothetical protein
MKLRQHRGGYDESMATVIDIEPTKAALLQAIMNTELIGLPSNLIEDQVTVEPYSFDAYPSSLDPRNGWNTHLVTIQGWGVYGYTDGPLNSIDVGSPNTIDGAVTSYYGVSTVNVLTPEEAQAKRPGFYPFATSPFMEEPRPPEIARDQTVLHQTVNGKGAVGRIK